MDRNPDGNLSLSLERPGEEYSSTATVDGSVEASTDATAKLDADARPGAEAELTWRFDVDFIRQALQRGKDYHEARIISTQN